MVCVWNPRREVETSEDASVGQPILANFGFSERPGLKKYIDVDLWLLHTHAFAQVYTCVKKVGSTLHFWFK